MLKAVPVHQRFAFVVVAVFRQAVADIAEADVIRAVQRDAVPGQRAIGGGELVAARAGVGGLPTLRRGRGGGKTEDKCGEKQSGRAQASLPRAIEFKNCEVYIKYVSYFNNYTDVGIHNINVHESARG